MREQIRVGIRNLVKRLMKALFGKCYTVDNGSRLSTDNICVGVERTERIAAHDDTSIVQKKQAVAVGRIFRNIGDGAYAVDSRKPIRRHCLAEQLGYLASGCRTVEIGGSEFICDDSGSLGIRNIFGIPFAGSIRNGFVQIQRVCA